MLKIGIPDDYADVVRTLPSFAKIAGHAVSIWTDAAPDIDGLAARELLASLVTAAPPRDRAVEAAKARARAAERYRA